MCSTQRATWTKQNKSKYYKKNRNCGFFALIHTNYQLWGYLLLLLVQSHPYEGLESNMLVVNLRLLHICTVAAIGLQLWNIKKKGLCIVAYLVRVYSLSPECRFMAENVPIQPLNRLSLPIFHVTNSGLKNNKGPCLSSWTFNNVHILCI